MVIGGGFIGSEIAAALAMNGLRGDDGLSRDRDRRAALPAPTSPGSSPATTAPRASRCSRAKPSRRSMAHGDRRHGRVLEADGVIAGLGIAPVTELAEEAGLSSTTASSSTSTAARTGARTSSRRATWPASRLRRSAQMRVEHEDHANSHGRTVGPNMAGAGEPYGHLPFFYSDLFELGYEAVGEPDSRLRTTADWTDVGRAGTVYYMDDEGRPRGVLLWNLFGHVDTARDLIRAARPIETTELVA